MDCRSTTGNIFESEMFLRRKCHLKVWGLSYVGHDIINIGARNFGDLFSLCARFVMKCGQRKSSIVGESLRDMVSLYVC